MIHWIKRDLFATDATILINPVNTKGVSERGLALEFKKRYPENFIIYKEICDLGMLKPGQLFIFPDKSGQIIVNFATKDHWKNSSKYEWIEKGLDSLREELQRTLHKLDLAIPYIGCGLGGLEKEKVSILIVKYLKKLENNIFVCDI